MSNFFSLSIQPVSENCRSVNSFIKGYVPLFYDGILGFPNKIPNGIKEYLPMFDKN